MTDEPFTPLAGYLQIQPPGLQYAAIRVPITGQLDVDSTWVEHAMLIAELARNAYREAFGAADPGTQNHPDAPPRQNAPRSPQRAQGGQQSAYGQQETRESKFPVLEGWECDRCGGPVGRRAATGNMSSDVAVCLGRCKDGRFVHSVAWLDD